MDTLLTLGLSLLSGFLGACFGYLFASKQGADTRRVEDATARLDHCDAIVAARTAYAAAWHRGGSSWRQLKRERLALEAAHPFAVPALVLDGEEAWEDYVSTEQRLRHDTTTPREERALQLEAAGLEARKVIAARRDQARG